LVSEHDRRPIVEPEEGIIDVVSSKVRRGPSKKVLGVQISGSSVDRMYPAEAMIEAMRMIAAHITDVAIVVLSAPSEEGTARYVAEQTGAVYVQPGPTYQHFAAAIASCDWLLSPDTAAIHVAAAHNIPCVVLFSRDHRGFLNWLPYKTYCDPVITDGSSLAAISPGIIADKVIAMISR
jgi:ADP-heptose:LPS heptosyltransferase